MMGVAKNAGKYSADDLIRVAGLGLREQTLSESLENYEAKIFSRKYETAVILDKKGALVLEKNGTSNAVTFTADERGKMSNCIMTHNHPSGWNYPTTDPRYSGNSFSPDDIQFAAFANLAEIRATTPVYRYTMRPGSGGWSSVEKIKKAYKKFDNEVREELLAKINSGTLSPAEASSLHWHLVNERVANEIGLVYNREDHNY